MEKASSQQQEQNGIYYNIKEGGKILLETDLSLLHGEFTYIL
jgi:hypothetical protein